MKIRNNHPMKPHFKPPATHLQTTWRKAIILHSSFFILHSAFASVPLAWQVTPRNPAPVAFDRHHGETLEFRCQFEGFGELPFGQAADIRLWYQTNGMAAAWWSVPASVSSNVLSATFPPQADPGADRLALFFGAPSNAYASAVLRLRHSPGFTPNVLPVPESGYTETDPVFSAWLATNDLLRVETDPTVPEWAKSETPPQTMTTNDVCAIVTNETPGAYKLIPHLDEAQWEFSGTGVVQGVAYSLTFYFTYDEDRDGVSYYSWHCELSGSDGTHGIFGPSYNGTNDVITSMTFFNDDWEDIGIMATQILPPPRNALGLARLIDLPPLTNGIPDIAARAVYDVHDLMWDETESILYWHRIRQGHDEYIAVTNINLTHPTNAVILKAWREANQ